MTRRADGTVGHPYSALNLRLALALFGLVFMLVLAGFAFVIDAVPVAVLALLVAAGAALNAWVVQLRRKERGGHHSLFE